MTDPMKIRATIEAGFTELKVFMSHPMETGMHKDALGGTAAAHYITEISATCAGNVVLQCRFSQFVAKNPYLAFKFKGGAIGDQLQVRWLDNLGEKRTDTVTLE